MITATGAGGSICAAPPKRLKPKSPKSPRNPPTTRLNQHPRNPSPPSPLQSRSVPPHGSTPSSQSFLLSRTNSLPSTTRPSPDRHISLLDLEDYNRTSSRSSVEEDFFGRHPFSTGSLESGHEPPSPRSFYSAATASSASTTKAGGGRSLEEESPITPVAPAQLQQSPSPEANRKPKRPTRPSSPPNLSGSLLGDRAASGSSLRSHGIGSFASYSSSHLSGQSPTLGPQHGEQAILRDFENMSPNNSIRDLCIAVVGARGVGKSTFIQRAYDLKSPPNEDAVTAKLMTVERSLCTVKLVEIDLAELDLDSQQLIWPRTMDGQRLPFVDGVLILYDVTNPASIAKLPESLDAFARAALPTLVVSCKCDAPQRQLNPNSIEQVGIVGGYDTMQTSGTSPDTQKKCLTAILGMIARKNEKGPRNLNGRRRANSSAANNSRATSPRPSTARSGHSRASSEFSTTYMKEYPEGAAQSAHAAQARIPRSPINSALGALGAHNSSSSLPTSSLSADTRGPRLSGGSSPQITLSASSGPLLEVVSTSPFSMQQPQGARQAQNGSPLAYAPSNDTDRGRNSFLDMDDENGGLKDVDDIPILEREGGIEDFEEEKTTSSKGFTFDELVDRLLRQHMSRGDQDFATIFLCFYRKFAPPRDLLNAILGRFERSICDQIALHRISAQLRYCNILHQWVSTHPGDFAHPKTRQRLLSFLDVISSNRSLALLASEMRQMLAQGIEDDDGVWARSDSDTERKDSLRSFLTTHSAADSLAEGEGGYINIGTASEGNLQITSDKESNLRASEMTSSGSVRTCDAMSSAHQPLLQKSEDSVLDGASMWKEQYELFMSIPDDEIATELTRIDWLEFSSIKCRDLVRHVSIPADQKEKYPSLRHVNRMISHFNHVAYWVARVILEKPKAKHRARALEKFMNVAWTLRHMNNYNALGAVIAGINGTAVHRLSLTRELVSQNTHRQFMRLELLMGTHMSHSKYRLAWENTSTERIPFIPLHRRDLVSADEGNRTFLADGDKINWNKFQVMGDVLMVLVKSQATPYRDLARNHIVEKLITDAVVSMDDDELYERSVQLENVGGAEKTRRRIWFQR